MELSQRRPFGKGEESEADTDGRVARGRRNRERILQAIYELVRENERTPTADEVAARADVGQRTVFRHFSDLGSLQADMAARVQREVLPMLLERVPPNADLDARVAELVRKRARVFEYLAPFRRVADSSPADAPDEGPAQLTKLLRTELERVLDSEWPALRPDLREAVDALASFEMWSRLRRQQGLSRRRAERVVIEGLEALLRGS